MTALSNIPSAELLATERPPFIVRRLADDARPAVPAKFVLNNQGHILNAEIHATSRTQVEELADFIDAHNRAMRRKAENAR